MSALERTGLPRGAVAVAAVGLLLCGATALLTVGEDEGGVQLEWEQSAEIDDAEPAELGDGGQLQIVEAGIESTRANASGYKLFRIAATLELDLGGFGGRSQARCTVSVPRRSILARTLRKRAAYPLPSEDLRIQAVPELSVVRFNAKGTDLVGVEISDAFDQFTDTNGVLVEWAPYRQGEQTWEWSLPAAARDLPERLSFATMWRTTDPPGAEIACGAKAGPSRARTTTSGELD